MTAASPDHSRSSVEDLLTALDSRDLGERLQAINRARHLGSEACFTVLQKGITDNNPRVRYAAVSQMGTLPLADPQIAADLITPLLREDPEFDVRAAAAAALGDLKTEGALEELLQAYRKETEWLVRFSVVAALGELGNPGAFDTLAEALNRGDDLTRTAAAAALGDLRDERGIPLLELLIADEDWQLRYRVALALHQIGGEASRPGLERLARDPVPQVAEQARQALADLQA